MGALRPCDCACADLHNACNCSPASGVTDCHFKSGAAEICGIPEFETVPEHWFRKRTTTGTMTLSKYPDAQCEGVIPLGATLSCRSKGGNATLQGFSEYASPSVPPKKYLKQTISGKAYGCPTRDIGGCGPLDSGGGSGVIYDGFWQYDPVTLSLTTTAKQTGFSWDDHGTCGAEDHPGAENPVGLPWDGSAQCSPSPDVTTLTPTEKEWDGVYCPGGFHPAGCFNDHVKKELSEEDTEDTAMAREDVGDWSGAGDCDDHTSYLEARGAGDFTFSFQQAQTRVTITSGLVAGKNYEYRIQLGRRAFGAVTAFVPTGSPIVNNFTADDVGYVGDWIDLIQESGWEYAALSVEVYGHIEKLTVDEWHVTETFNSATCVQTLDDTSVRTVDGVPEEGPFDQIPPNVYGAHADVDTTPTLRTTTGADECNADDGGYVQANGKVQEQLSEEDTVQDAAGRAMNGITEWTSGGCDLPAFMTARTPGNTVFGFRWLQVRAILSGLTAGGTYKITWRTYRRPNGSSLPYAYYGDLIQNTDATGPTKTTDWVDVPNQEGWDTLVTPYPPKVEQIA